MHFGVAGWSYADWVGCVYPTRLAAKDQLAYLAGYVDLIEINSSFYRPPSPHSAELWVERVASHPEFFFTAKLHQDVTHRGLIDPSTARAFEEGFAPLAAAGKLRQLLAQFRYDFSDSPERRGHLRAIRDRFGGLAEIVLELRHNSWQGPDALEFLASLGVTVANLDYPMARDSFSLRECRIGANGYFRLHGRNRKAWFDRNAGRDETYDYLYSPEELVEIRERILALALAYKSLSVVTNNHFRGKEVANALELKSMVLGTNVRVPPDLLLAYPRLERIAERSAT
jgi:uncharacterized protein YecE (DUF72 family)